MGEGPDILGGAATTDRSRWWLVLGVAVAAIVVLVLLRGGGSPDRAAGGGGGGPTTPPAGTSSAAASSAVSVDPAYAVGGSLPVTSQPHSGGSATQAARTVANGYCDRIDSWRIAVLSSADDFAETTLQLTPSGTAYRGVRITIVLSWQGDHYDWVGDRRDLDACP